MGSLTENLVLLHLRVLQQSPMAGSWMAGKLYTFVTILADLVEEPGEDKTDIINWNRLADRMESAASKVR